MKNGEVSRSSPAATARNSYRETLSRFFELNVRNLLTPGHVFGGLPNPRVVEDQLYARCPLHGGHELQVDLKTCEWICPATNRRSGPLEFVRHLLEASDVGAGDGRLLAITELALRCGVEVPGAVPVVRAPSEADATWRACTTSLFTDPSAKRWLERNGLNCVAVESYDVLRVVMPSAQLPAWAGFGLAGHWCSWPQAGYRIVIPLVNAFGELCSLMFCSPLARLAPAVTSPQTTACVMADGVMCSVLASGSAPRFLRPDKFCILVVSGLVSFLRHVTGRGTEVPVCWPVLGLVGGALDPAIAARLPRGTHLISAVGRSVDADRVHARLEADVAARCPDLTVSRWSPQ